MRERPILFSGPMVRAILAGQKTQTRRPVKPQPLGDAAGVYADRYNHGSDWAFWLPDNRMTEPRTWRCPYGAPGDRLWVRESWADGRRIYPFDPFIFRAATDAYDEEICRKEDDRFRWRPSIHLPRRAARLVIDVTDVRVERLWDVSDADACAEGVMADWDGDPSVAAPRGRFRALWERINGAFSWDPNPWVWVVTFRRVDAARSAA
jgi:hypothetical protein